MRAFQTHTAPDTLPAPQPVVEPRRTGLPVQVTIAASPPWDLTDCEPLARLAFALAVDDRITLACCLLPDRLDWLLASGIAVTAKVQRLQQTTTHAARRLGIHRDLWLGPFEVQVLDDHELETAARRIVEGPVTAGLVAAAVQWPYQMRRL